MEQVRGIEPPLQPWEGRVLPLNHTCIPEYIICSKSRDFLFLCLKHYNEIGVQHDFK